VDRFTDKHGRKKPMTSSVEAYKKLKKYEDADAQQRVLPPGYSWRRNAYTEHFQLLHNGFVVYE